MRFLAPLVPLWRRSTSPPTGQAAIAACQERILRRLLVRLAPTAVGRRFALAGMTTADFRASVPIVQYADLADEIARVATGAVDVLFPGRAVALAQTSGTTRAAAAGERYIPQDRALLAHHRRGGSAALARLLGVAPGILGGRLLMLGGCTALDRSGPVPVGDLSGIGAAGLPAWIRGAYEPGPAISAIPDWETRLTAMAERLRGRDVRLASGIPAWLLMLLERLPRNPWPRLQGVIHGGHAVEPLVPTLLDRLDGGTWMQEVYPASEAFIAVGSAPWRLGDGRPAPLELLTDHGVYLEFAEDSGSIVGAHALQPGGVYRVLVTTPAGLLRYQVGDLVRAEGPGLVRFAGRVKARISVFGEHVEGDALAGALQEAATATGARIAHYHVAPLLPAAGEPRGAHEWWVEFAGPAADPAVFSAVIDAALRRRVLDYAAHRDGGQLREPALRPVPPGTFHAYLAARGHLGNQHKVPQARNDRSIADRLAVHASPSANPTSQSPSP